MTHITRNRLVKSTQYMEKNEKMCLMLMHAHVLASYIRFSKLILAEFTRHCPFFYYSYITHECSVPFKDFNTFRHVIAKQFIISEILKSQLRSRLK